MTQIWAVEAAGGPSGALVDHPCLWPAQPHLEPNGGPELAGVAGAWAGVPDLVGWVFKKAFLSTQQNSLN
jgi:hypothetical protein